MSGITVLTEETYKDFTASGVVVVDFYADWCGPCKMMAPMFAEASAAYEGKAAFAKINVDENRNVAMDNKIMGIPTLLLFKDGQIADRVTGVIDKGTLCGKIDALL